MESCSSGIAVVRVNLDGDFGPYGSLPPLEFGTGINLQACIYDKQLQSTQPYRPTYIATAMANFTKQINS
jgi:hypothetical protein